MAIKALRGLALLCVLAAFLIRAIIPAGFMPDTTSGEAFKMVICTIDGPQTILVDKDFNPQKSDGHHKDNGKQDGLYGFSVNMTFAEAHYLSLTSAASFYGKAELLPADNHKVSSRFFGNASSRAPPVTSYA